MVLPPKIGGFEEEPKENLEMAYRNILRYDNGSLVLRLGLPSTLIRHGCAEILPLGIRKADEY